MFDWLGKFWDWFMGPETPLDAPVTSPVSMVKPQETGGDPSTAGWQIIGFKPYAEGMYTHDPIDTWQYSLKDPAGHWVTLSDTYGIKPRDYATSHIVVSTSPDEALNKIQVRLIKSIKKSNLINTPGRNYTL